VFASHTASGQVLNESAKLLASDGAADDRFGDSVSVSGDTAVVGAFYDDDAGTDSGSAYVYLRSGGVWTQQQKLTALDATGGDKFGYFVSIDGDTAIIGAPGDGLGSAYVFVRSGGVWTQQQKLTATATGGEYAYSVSVSGDTAVVGAHYDGSAGSYSGAAYVYVRSGGVWTEQQKLTASDAAAGDRFGGWVSVSGDTAVVGAADDDNAGGGNAGSAYVFVRSGTVWTQQRKLTASDAAADDFFGASVSVSGDTAVVGALFDDCAAGNNCGSAYVYVRSGVVWTEQQKLTASDAAASDEFGHSVSVSGDTAVVGAILGDCAVSGDCGSAYVFVRSGVVWSQQQKLTASDAAVGDWFGVQVSVNGDTAVVGAYLDDHAGGSNAGSAYVFNILGTCCIANGSCEAEGNCQENIAPSECQALGGRFFGPNLSCAQVCANGACIPAVSTWGVIVLLLLLTTAGTILLAHRRIRAG
jgi:hypothetical protein